MDDDMGDEIEEIMEVFVRFWAASIIRRELREDIHSSIELARNSLSSCFEIIREEWPHAHARWECHTADRAEK